MIVLLGRLEKMEDQKKMTHARTEENWVPLEPASDKNGQIRLKFLELDIMMTKIKSNRRFVIEKKRVKRFLLREKNNWNFRCTIKWAGLANILMSFFKFYFLWCIDIFFQYWGRRKWNKLSNYSYLLQLFCLTDWLTATTVCLLSVSMSLANL